MKIRKIITYIGVSLIFISGIITLLSFFIDLDFLKENPIISIIVGVVLILLSIGYAWYKLFPTKRVHFKLQSQLDVQIEVGDLFKKKGVIAIPVNEYFDTHIGDTVVDGSSVHGQFIKNLYDNNTIELDNSIQEYLDQKNIKPIGHKERLNAKPDNYELGTCVDIEKDGNIYVLFAFTHFDDNNTAYVTHHEYNEVIEKLIAHIVRISESRSVYMPLIGTQLSRLNLTSLRALLLLLGNIDFMCEQPLVGGLNIELKALNNIDLKEVESYFKNM